MSLTNKSVLLAAFAITLFANDLAAHHPMNSQYSTINQYVIEGVLQRVDISSPHTLFYVEFVDIDDVPRTLKVEWGSGTTLNRYYSINSNSIRIGQRIRVTGYLSTNPEDLMLWPTSIYTEYDLSYDRQGCNDEQKSGNPCVVLTKDPPLWPVLNQRYLEL